MLSDGRAVAIRLFDYAAAATFGALAATASSLVVPGALPMPVAMLLGMIVGTLAAIPLLGAFTYLLGGFELVVMSGQIGMVAGMVGTVPVSDAWEVAALTGACAGVGVLLVLHFADMAYHGEVRR